MNSELINALISQIGNIVGIPLAAVLAVWQVKKYFTSTRNDEVNEKSFGLCCELFDLVRCSESYNKEVTDKIAKMVKERNNSQKLLHPEILRTISEIETYKKILNRIDEKDKLACRREKKINKRLCKDYEILCAYVSNEDNRLRKALGYPRDTLYSFHVLRYGSEGLFKLFIHLMEAVSLVLFGILVCFVVSLGTSWLIGIGSLIVCSGAFLGIIQIWRMRSKYSPNSFQFFLRKQKREIREEHRKVKVVRKIVHTDYKNS